MATSTNSRNLLLSTAVTRTVTNQKSVTVYAPTTIFLYTSAGTLSDSTATIAVTATKQNTTAAVTWTNNSGITLYSAATGGVAVTTDTGTTNTSVVYVRAADFNTLNLNSLRVTATVTDVNVFTDSITITKLQPGSKGDPGASGTRYITVTAYIWSNTTINLPLASKAAVYTWSTNSYDVAPTTSWSSSAAASPGTGYTLYQASVIVSGAATDLTSTFNWNTALLNQIGYRQDGSIGPTGDSARVAYLVTTSATVPGAVTAGTGTGTTGLANDVPPTSTAGTWSFIATSILNPGEYLYQVDGQYKPLSTTITWGNPYLSNLKVGSLSALAVDTGNLTVSTAGSIKNVGGGYNTTGFFLGYDTNAYKFSVGSGTNMLTWNGNTLSVPAATITGTLTASQIAAEAITTEKLATGAVTAGKVSANAITAESIVVTSFGEGVLLNPSFEQASAADSTLPAHWRRGTTWGGTSTTSYRSTTDFLTGTAALTLNPGAGAAADMQADLVPVVPGDIWVLSFKAISKNTNAGTSPGFYSRIRGGSTSTSNTTETLSYAIDNIVVPNTWTQYSAQFIIPTGMTWGSPIFLHYITNTGCSIHVDDVVFKKVTGSGSIQAGAVTAEKINITAGSSTGRIVINNNQIVVYDDAGNIRVKIGSLA